MIKPSKEFIEAISIDNMSFSDFDLSELLFKYDKYWNEEEIDVDLANSLVDAVPLLVREIKSLREENN